ncbi:hypothetical protein HOY80DRAFT_1027974 [Tuber brumale]|nr:hypothetical protein HOY80DRAFT_1027974 [Tuber brumale]
MPSGQIWKKFHTLPWLCRWSYLLTVATTSTLQRLHSLQYLHQRRLWTTTGLATLVVDYLLTCCLHASVMMAPLNLIGRYFFNMATGMAMISLPLIEPMVRAPKIQGLSGVPGTVGFEAQGPWGYAVTGDGTTGSGDREPTSTAGAGPK